MQGKLKVFDLEYTVRELFSIKAFFIIT
uniref:Uncharacterized protein n=1 Tax=Anguilla anguilla TaxID=7936 RepID=A0A0E9R3G2_ANGAN